MEEDGNNWDLQAVVRGCRFSGGAAAAAADPFSSFPAPAAAEVKLGEEAMVGGGGGGGDGFLSPDLLLAGRSRSGLEELQELYMAFFPKQSQQQQQQQQKGGGGGGTLHQPHPPPLPSSPSSSSGAAVGVKNQQKRVVCHVPADGVSSDMWAWRKYGQKPIKGSPYPRYVIN
ncbi:WRKY transcription factor 22-like [Ananas comosus]|uniref:WRKY transcription factor 22-like n=1 Tax=Ananas comosus TaxID=4615 RepID=A0A6P5F540_ANACO|nr:WRKY transcription factor 22-like [Ananas comosus]